LASGFCLRARVLCAPGWNLTDQVLLGWLFASGAVILLRRAHVPHWGALFWIDAGLAAFILLLARPSGSGVLRAIHSWYPLPYFAFFFEEMQFLVHAFHQDWFDVYLIAIDRALFGVNPTVWAEQFATYWLTELLQLAYASYFVLPFTVGITLWVMRRGDEFDRFMLANAVAYVTCYIVFVAFPIEGPFHTLRHLQQVELTGGPVNAAVEWIERYGRVHGGAFPSAHMAGSVVALLTASRAVPRLGRALLPVVMAIAAATIYGRYHYAVDVVAGVGVGTMGVMVAWRRAALKAGTTVPLM
jgi:membrane-associated phospholipid phosphatase